MENIRFPNLGLNLHGIKDGFTIFGVEIKFYGLLIAMAFLFAYIVVTREAKKTKQNPDDYLDYMLWMVIPAFLGARIFYIMFNLSDYFHKGKGFLDTIYGLINIRNGGLALYGGVIAAVIVAVKFTRKKNLSLSVFMDTMVVGVLLGQIIGRFGNFFNREAFGEYTDSLFAMAIPTDYYGHEIGGLVNDGVITNSMAQHVSVYDGMQWISVHPTFLYEMLWNLCLLVAILIYRKHKKFDGELALMYLWGYGLGRVWIEALRTDALLIPGLKLRASQMIAAACVLVASVILVKKRFAVAKISKDEG